MSVQLQQWALLSGCPPPCNQGWNSFQLPSRRGRVLLRVFFPSLICKHGHWWMKPQKQADILKELFSDFCPFSPWPAEGGQSSSQFQGRPSEVWSQWQSQHHNQQSGDQHSHPQPSQTEVFQVRGVQRAQSPSDNFSLLSWRTVALHDWGASRAWSNYFQLCVAVGLRCCGFALLLTGIS